MKRIVTIQDISCIGKCSLTVALPIISAMGVETAIIPTAVLSTHTAFENFTFHDLTDEINPIKNHWINEKIKFDAIYTGYLGSERQIDIAQNFFCDMKTDNNIIIVDPAMADNGKLYKGFDNNFVEKMAHLCSQADIILPNITESAFILGCDYIESGYDENYIKNMLRDLCNLGAKEAVITGVSFDKDKIGVMGYNSETKEFTSYFNEKITKSFHGTGDVFASCFTGALMNDFSADKALEIAADFTVETIKETVKDKNSNWYGVNFESALPYLIKRIGL